LRFLPSAKIGVKLAATERERQSKFYDKANVGFENGVM